jgi:hypothetical protein
MLGIKELTAMKSDKYKSVLYEPIIILYKWATPKIIQKHKSYILYILINTNQFRDFYYSILLIPIESYL